MNNLKRSGYNRSRSCSDWQHRSRESNWCTNLDRSRMDSNRCSMSYHGGKGNFIISINGFCFSISLLSLNSSIFGSSMGGKMFSFSSGNLRSINHRFKGSNKGDSRYFRGNWKDNIRIGSSNREVGGSNSESIDRV